MPRPPQLPKIDWKEVVNQGKSYEAWISQAEFKSNALQMETARKSLTLSPELKAYLGGISRPVYVIALAEDWCGDVVRHVPVLQKLADLSSQIVVRYISREDRPDVFVRFLTNGGEAIPKFIFLSEQFVECANWGPMPQQCCDIIARGKASGNVAAARSKVSMLYELDSSLRQVVKELLDLIDITLTEDL